MPDKLIERINELANKAKETELSAEEKNEQDELRKKYLASFRQGLEDQLANVKVIDPEGEDVTPDKVKELKNKKK